MNNRTFTVFTQRMDEILHELEFRFYLVGTLPPGSQPMTANDVIAARWAGLSPSTCEALLLTELVALFGCSVLPFVGGRFLFDEQRMFDTSEGPLGEIAAFTFHDVAKIQYVVAYGMGARTITAQEIGLLHHRSVRAVEVFSGRPPVRRAAGLSTREIECLAWSAAGKSSEQIAAILDLSPHTINAHLQSSVRKLDTSNRTHAVARACRLGLI